MTIIGVDPSESQPLDSSGTASTAEAAVIRELIWREDAVLNSRLTWCGTIEGLFMAALAFSWEKAPAALTYVLAFAGLLVAMSTLYATTTALRTMEELTHWWKSNASPDYRGPVVIGREVANWKHQLLRPSIMLPWVFMITWVGVALVRWSHSA